MIRYAIELLRTVKARLSDERGQDVMEYALLAGFIGIALAVAFVAAPIGPSMTAFAGAVASCINVTAATYSCP